MNSPIFASSPRSRSTYLLSLDLSAILGIAGDERSRVYTAVRLSDSLSLYHFCFHPADIRHPSSCRPHIDRIISVCRKRPERLNFDAGATTYDVGPDQRHLGNLWRRSRQSQPYLLVAVSATCSKKRTPIRLSEYCSSSVPRLCDCCLMRF